MDLSPSQIPQPPRAQRSVPACPWCGAGTALTVRGDGFGHVSLTCTCCGSSGPKATLDGDFAEGDAAAITLWSRRRQPGALARETMARIRVAIGLHCLTGTLTPDAAVSVPWADLDALLRSAAGGEDAVAR